MKNLKEQAEGTVPVFLTGAEIALLAEALDSHRYWQLSEEEYRDSGYVTEPGSNDPDTAAEIVATERLEAQLRGLLG